MPEAITKLPKKNSKAPKIIELKNTNPNLTVRQIAEIVNCNHSNVVQTLARYGINPEQTTNYKNNRADILAGLQHNLLSSITLDDIKKAPMGSRVLAVAQLYDKERLERGQSTSNISYFDESKRLRELEAEETEILKKIEAKSYQQSPVSVSDCNV